MATKWALFVHANLSTIPCTTQIWQPIILLQHLEKIIGGVIGVQWQILHVQVSCSSFCKGTRTLSSRVTLVRNLKSFCMSLISCRTVGRFISAFLLVLDDLINFFTGGNSKSSSLSSESIKIELRFKDLWTTRTSLSLTA